MKLAILSDIHGNLAAFRAALGAAKTARADAVAILGDVVGYYYDTAAVIDLVRDTTEFVVRGNHERMFIDRLEGRSDGSEYRSKYGSSLDLAVGRLTTTQVDWLLGLKDCMTLEIGGRRLQITHEAPGIAGGYLYPDAPMDLFNRARPSDCEAFCFGHTHYPLTVVCDGCLMINPGSVGQARDIGGLAQWAVLHLDTLAVELHRTPYDTGPLEAAALALDSGLPYLREVLRRGRAG